MRIMIFYAFLGCWKKIIKLKAIEKLAHNKVRSYRADSKKMVRQPTYAQQEFPTFGLCSPTFGKFTSAQFVPVHHFVILINPASPSRGAPWYASQSKFANGLKLFPFLPDCMAQTVKFWTLTFSVHDVIAWWTVTESFKFMWFKLFEHELVYLDKTCIVGISLSCNLNQTIWEHGEVLHGHVQ